MLQSFAGIFRVIFRQFDAIMTRKLSRYRFFQHLGLQGRKDVFFYGAPPSALQQVNCSQSQRVWSPLYKT